ncbi:UPF0102 protein [Tersicoccus solisilvae]|uniref:UPF0102 protein GCM10011512_22720 n=1 Tax=Tersicoccus solisilvae TaxID=1882339 RepID=A0ABQ1PDL5_9MICC|nr:YraN family protein [Tersicoccus solisilvae]GGC95133.1 UPF0102 protein [Tersicoccus solisilvae]
MRRKDLLGRAGEEFAARYVTELGWRLLDRNWRCPAGELDLVALDPMGAAGPVIVAVEVKTRRSLDFGHPWEAIDAAKLARLHALIRLWAHEHGVSGPVRVDAVAVVGAAAADMRCEHLRAVA